MLKLNIHLLNILLITWFNLKLVLKIYKLAAYLIMTLLLKYLFTILQVLLISYSYATFIEKHAVKLLQRTPFEENAFGKYGIHKMYGSWKLVSDKQTLK